MRRFVIVADGMLMAVLLVSSGDGMVDTRHGIGQAVGTLQGTRSDESHQGEQPAQDPHAGA